MAHQVVPVDLPWVDFNVTNSKQVFTNILTFLTTKWEFIEYFRASQRITPAQLKEKIDKENVYVVDVRNPSEIKSSIKTSSINIPINVVGTCRSFHSCK